MALGALRFMCMRNHQQVLGRSLLANPYDRNLVNIVAKPVFLTIPKREILTPSDAAIIAGSVALGGAATQIFYGRVRLVLALATLGSVIIYQGAKKGEMDKSCDSKALTSEQQQTAPSSSIPVDPVKKPCSSCGSKKVDCNAAAKESE